MVERPQTSALVLAAGAKAAARPEVPPNFGIEFYHQRVFQHFEVTHRDRIYVALKGRAAELRHQTFLKQLSRNQEYAGQDAWNICYVYLDAIESAMAKVLSRHSVFFWVHLYRRIGVQLAPFHGGRMDATTLGLVRQIAELAISKHGDMSRHDDAALSAQIHFKEVLGGHYRRLWTKWIGGRAAVAKFRALAETNQWVLTRFEIRDYIDIYTIEGYAYEYWRVTALMRAVGKGAGFVLREDDWPDNVATPEFRRLIRSYDRRIDHLPFSTALLGSWFYSPIDAPTPKSALLIASYNVEQRPASEVLKGFGARPVVETFVSNFLVGDIDIIAFRKAHAFLAGAFMKAIGVELDTYLLCLWALSNIVLLPARVLSAAAKTAADFLDPKGPMFTSFLNVLQRAYSVFNADQPGLVEEVLARASAFEGDLSIPTRDQAAACIEQLVLAANKRNQIGLWSGGRRFPVIPFGHALVIDLQGIPSLLNSLFYRIQYEQTVRGSVFEEAFRAALETEHFEQPHSGEVVAFLGDKREIDASVKIGEQLVIFECRSIERPLDYELGQPRTLETRSKLLDEKVDQVLSLREFLIGNPVGRNYDFRWAKNILAFVVSPFVEWIWEESERYWYDERTPRILQADEAIAFLRQLSEALGNS